MMRRACRLVLVGIVATGAGLVRAELRVQRVAPNGLRVLYWAGDVELATRAQWCAGALETRAVVRLEEAEPDSTRFGEPALSFVTARVLLPPGKRVGNVSVVRRRVVRERTLAAALSFNDLPYDGYDMTDPAQARAWAEDNRPAPDIYGMAAWYPADPVSWSEREFRGYRLLRLAFSPFRYDPSRVLLQWFGEFHLAVQLEEAPDTGLGCRDCPNDRSLVRRLVLNPEVADEYPRAVAESAASGPGIAAVPGAETNAYYVIITGSNYVSSFETLRQYHSYDTQHQAAVVSVEDIYAYDPATNTPGYIKIHDYICEVLYSNACEYVLIGGDTEIVPSYGGYSDMYYSGRQLPVGRFSVESAADISNCIAKAMTPVSNGTDKVMLVPRADEIGPSLYAYSNLFVPYLEVDADSSLYNGAPSALFDAMDTHTILWARGHGYYLYPHWGPSWYSPDNSAIRPFGLNFGCSGCVFDWDEHPAEIYHGSANGNGAYIGTVVDVPYNSFDTTFFRAYFENGTVGPRLGDLLLVATAASGYYTLLGDPLQELVSAEFQAMPRLTTPGASGFSRSYNIDQGDGQIDDVVFPVMSFNACGWLITNFVCDAGISNHLAFSCLNSNRPLDVALSFLDVTNIPPGQHTASWDILDTTNGYERGSKSLNLIITDMNILTDEDFVYDGDVKTLPAGAYVLAEHLIVEDGTTLRLEAGVTLQTHWDYGQDWRVKVRQGGAIEALGSVSNVVRFGDAMGGGSLGLELEGTELMPLSGDFRYCWFGGMLLATNRPAVSFLNCTFLLSFGTEPLFPAGAWRGTMRNCLISAQNMGNRAPVGDLSGFDVSYCCIVPETTNGIPEYPAESVGLVWGNDFLEQGRLKLVSACINAGDPVSPPDPDGTRCDIGACYRDLSGAVRVPQDHATIQAALDAAAAVTTEVAVVVAPGEYNESVTIPNMLWDCRVMGTSPTNRPVLCMSNHPADLVTLDSSVLFESFVFRNIGSNGTGRTVWAGTDNVHAGFVNCEFSGNRENSALLRVQIPGFGNGVCLYVRDTQFFNNMSNETLLSLADKTTEGWMEPWSWIKNCSFSNNLVTGSLLSYTETDRHFCGGSLTFVGNTASDLVCNAATGTMTNVTLAIDNSVWWTNTGNWRAENDGHTRFRNCTFAGNSGDLIAGGNSTVTVQNCIFWENSLNLTESLGGVLLVDYTDTDAACPRAGAGNLNTNPLFVSAATGDFHLEATSACIDAGASNAACIAEPAPNGGRVNMGRYGNTPEATAWRLGVGTTNIVATGSSLELYVPAVSGWWFRVEYSPDLIAPAWTNVWESMATSEVLDVTLPVPGTQGFYRAVNYRP